MLVELGTAGPIAAIAAPLVLALAMLVPALRPGIMRLAPWAALVALLVATGLVGTSSVHWKLVLFGMRLGMEDTIAREFLLLTSVVWLASGLFARGYMATDPRRARFWSFFLATAGANLGIVLARDVATFYMFYALMTFASYGLIVHTPTASARRAGLVYLIMALVGEMLLVAAFFLIVGASIDLPLDAVPRAVAGSPHRDLIVALVLVGFGVKVGALVLHMWLPLAHPVAPTPGSAVLSGALIKAGVLAWLRFLPLGIVELPGPGFVCVIAGLAAAFYGVAIGLTQRDPKTILAYSSVSQMGFVTTTLGIALAEPVAAPAAISAILFFTLHHALAKGALFLGTGVVGAAESRWPRRLALLVLLVPALDLAGAPLSSGALAKLSVKDVMALAPWNPAPFGVLLSLGAIASTALMGHFLTTIHRQPSDHTQPSLGTWAAWIGLVIADVAVVARPPVGVDPAALVHADYVWSAIWPVLVGFAIVGVARVLSRRGIRLSVTIPPGDVLVWFELAIEWLRELLITVVLRVERVGARVLAYLSRTFHGELVTRRMPRSLAAAELSLGGFTAIGVSFVGLATLAALLAWCA